MFRATVPAITVISRVSIFGLVINMVGEIADFGYKSNSVGVLGSRLHTPTKFFWEYPRQRCQPKKVEIQKITNCTFF